MESYRRLLACAWTATATACLLYAAVRRWRRRHDAIFHEVIFFPAVLPPPPPASGASGGCERGDSAGGGGAAALGCVLRRLRAARRSLDVCVFVLSCPELAGALVAASRRGCRVRVILDEEMSSCTGSQLTALRKVGVPVFVKPKPYLMHHKFAVVDDQVLVCGSFNWTRQAALGNNEDVIITNNGRLVKPFVGEFAKLWAMKKT